MDIQCAVAALCFLCSSLFGMLYSVATRKITAIDWDGEFAMDPTAIAGAFRARAHAVGWQYAAGCTNSVAWILLAILVCRLAVALTRQEQQIKVATPWVGTSIAMAVLALMGAVVRLMTWFLYLGLVTAMHWTAGHANLDGWLGQDIAQGMVAMESMIEEVEGVSSNPEFVGGDRRVQEMVEDTVDYADMLESGVDFSKEESVIIETPSTIGGVLEAEIAGAAEEAAMDGIGWKSLELFRMTMDGVLYWMASVEFLFLAAIFAIIFIAAKRSNTQIFTRQWASLSLLLSVLFVFEFIANMLTLHDLRAWKDIGIVVGGLNRMVLLPIWLLHVGSILPQDKREIVLPVEDEDMEPGEEDFQEGNI